MKGITWRIDQFITERSAETGVKETPQHAAGFPVEVPYEWDPITVAVVFQQQL